MLQTAAQRVAHFLPELDDIPDDTIEARLGARQFAEDVEQVLDERLEALEHLRRVVDHQGDACRFNHHGRCETHAVDGSSPGKCGVAEARAFLAGLPVEDYLP